MTSEIEIMDKNIKDIPKINTLTDRRMDGKKDREMDRLTYQFETQSSFATNNVGTIKLLKYLLDAMFSMINFGLQSGMNLYINLRCVYSNSVLNITSKNNPVYSFCCFILNKVFQQIINLERLKNMFKMLLLLVIKKDRFLTLFQ